MKTKFLTISLTLTLLLIFGCTSSDDESTLENIKKDDIINTEYSKIIDRINVRYNSDNRTLNKSTNNGKGVKHVAFYSDGEGFWVAEFPILNENGFITQVVVIQFPQNGEDRALVFNETEMMVNFTSHNPRLFIFDFSKGVVTYDNWCEEETTGLFKGRGKTEYASYPDDPNVYWWGPYAPVEGSDNYIFHIKATLTSDVCNVDGEPVEFSYTYQGQNGKIRQTSSIR